ncbi:hypothetical protein LB553_28700 [Mesorhizobium sp. CA8]|uniref:hypothetical protein n=1 Tax=unclassified Mesorhizobium TaxID=325217 RepID=UPI001CCF5589|nr:MULTISPECIES: hypothetical protein [unclassified Mesorhizobium]MBZ9764815.1 hypothetical protein [Mesorhizobium sp. CA8]MBZ9822749.1 hypothetical protein [Mesorhizobium sp. CA4]
MTQQWRWTARNPFRASHAAGEGLRTEPRRGSAALRDFDLFHLFRPNLCRASKVGPNGEFSQAVTVALEVACHVQSSLQPLTTRKRPLCRPNFRLTVSSGYGVQDKGLLKDGDLSEARDLLRRLLDRQDAFALPQGRSNDRHHLQYADADFAGRYHQNAFPKTRSAISLSTKGL